MARPDAQLIAVGKRCRQLSTDQRFINRALVEAAQRHAVVVRLKGGDPMIFGRAQEEIAALQAAGIAYEIVPGITSALAAAAELGVSLTRRGVSRNVVFVTPRVGEAESVSDWAHAMWLYYWLASYGINPLKDVKTITVPPPQMVANMRIGNMDGFCVGEPWNNRAIYDKIGFTAATTQDIWKDHPEKVLGCTAEFSQKYPNTARRVVILRRPVKQDLALTRRIKKQMELLLTDEAIQAYEYAVLVTNTAYNLHAIAQLYRDRADCENGFDELKNQWGWGGFTTQDIERCQTSARSVALIYNWWSWYCRAAKPDARMEAITSRPLLLAGVGRAVKHAGQTTLYLTAMHAASEHLNTLIANIHAALAHVKTLAEQLPKIDPWHVLLAHIISKITHRPPPIYARIFTLATG